MGDEPDTPDILYHYCSNAAFLSIVESGTIRLSDLSLSNDSQEGRWIRKVFEEYCRAQGLSEGHLSEALWDLDILIEHLGAAGFCMSEQSDALSQWRAYADDGFGMSIGFSAKHFGEISDSRPKDGFGFLLNKIVYKPNEQETVIADAANKIISHIEHGALRPQHKTLLGSISDEEIRETRRLRSTMSFTFLLFAGDLYTIKNPAFSEEAEWRLVSIISGKGSHASMGDLKSMDFRALRDRIVPFRALPLHHEGKSPVRKVVLGPRNITPISVVKSFLAKHGHEDVEVIPSAASYR